MLGIVTMLLGSRASAQRADASGFRRFLGCYRLTLSSWSKPYEYPQPPRIFRLEARPTDTTDDGVTYRVVSPNPPGFGKFPPGWTLRGPDSVEVFWSTGYTGVTLRLVARAGVLTGRAQAFSDIVGPDIIEAIGSARAARISCPVGLRDPGT